MPNYRSLVPGGYFARPEDNLPVSIRSNNPGAVNGAAWERTMPGYVKDIKFDGKNNTAIFETPEQGVAVWYELMRRYQSSGYKTLQQIVNYYGGGQDYSEYVQFVVGKTGFPRNKVIDLKNDSELLPFAKAMFHYEAGKPTPLSDAQILYGFKLGRGENVAPSPVPPPPVVAAPAPPEAKPGTADKKPGLMDGLVKVLGWPWNAPTKPPVAPSITPSTPTPSAPIAPSAPPGFADRILRAMKKKGYRVDEGEDVVNIVYVEGVNEDTGLPNDNRKNAFDDARVVLRIVNGVPKILGSWQATIETGVYFTEHPIAEDGAGAARITFDQQTAWQVGYHRGQYEALIQTGGPVSVYRDKNADYIREGDKITTGWYGINQHHAYNAPRDNIGRNSAGCLVGRMIKGHEEFMALVKSDKRYKANHSFVFSTTVLAQKEVLG